MENEDVNISINIDNGNNVEHVDIIDDDDMGEAETDDVVDLEQTGDNNKKRGRKQSIVWDHFNKPTSVPPEGARTTWSLYVTSSAYFHDMCLMHTHIDECIGNDDERLSHMAINMRLKYNKYWGDVEKMNPLLYIAVALDPRYKLSYVNWSLDDMYPTGNLATNLKKKVEETLTKLYDFYCSKDPKHGKSCTSKKSHNLGGISESLSIQERRMLKYKSHLEAGTMSELSELDRYLKDNKEPMYESFDLLHWWKINGEKYKILAKVARDVLAVPVSTVASESAFSTGGRILDPFRSSLSPKIVQALVCTQNWIQADFKKQASVEYKDMLKEIEEIEEIEKCFASKLNICTDHID